MMAQPSQTCSDFKARQWLTSLGYQARRQQIPHRSGGVIARPVGQIHVELIATIEKRFNCNCPFSARQREHEPLKAMIGSLDQDSLPGNLPNRSALTRQNFKDGGVRFLALVDLL